MGSISRSIYYLVICYYYFCLQYYFLQHVADLRSMYVSVYMTVGVQNLQFEFNTSLQL